ncbi:hypothetical protein OOU_Y34scaffold01098g1, partial [Pyricularia oryzae Y34]
IKLKLNLNLAIKAVFMYFGVKVLYKILWYQSYSSKTNKTRVVRKLSQYGPYLLKEKGANYPLILVVNRYKITS